jgi:hypothetical protein
MKKVPVRLANVAEVVVSSPERLPGVTGTVFGGGEESGSVDPGGVASHHRDAAPYVLLAGVS